MPLSYSLADEQEDKTHKAGKPDEADKEEKDEEGATLDFGIGLVYFKAPHYRGSDQDQDWFLPSPYFRYVSKKMEAEPSYLRGTFYENDKVALKLSINAGLAAESDENRARQGMPDLDWTLEIGPVFIWYIWEAEDESSYLSFEVPIRQVFATDFSDTRGIGILMVPFLNWVIRAKPSNYNIHTEITFAYLHATQKYHSYFYGVDQKFARAGRPAYAASSGNSGVHGTILVKKKFGKFTVAPFIRYDYLKKAVFADSPLVKRNSYSIFGVLTSYIF